MIKTVIAATMVMMAACAGAADEAFKPDSFMGIKFGEKLLGEADAARVNVNAVHSKKVSVPTYRHFKEKAEVFGTHYDRICSVWLEEEVSPEDDGSLEAECKAVADDLTGKYKITFTGGGREYSFYNGATKVMVLGCKFQSSSGPKAHVKISVSREDIVNEDMIAQVIDHFRGHQEDRNDARGGKDMGAAVRGDRPTEAERK